uniref:Exonuclease domain-containing protein n=1 Tax=Romanomermis culicivorax TaxID=13658 RepID=A0A915K6B2_ROMCU
MSQVEKSELTAVDHYAVSDEQPFLETVAQATSSTDVAHVNRSKNNQKQNNKQRPRLEFERQRDFSRPVSLFEFRNFILQASLRDDSPFKPRFCKVRNAKHVAQTTFIIVDCKNCELLADLDGHYEFFNTLPYIRDNFAHRFYLSYTDDNDFYGRIFRIPQCLTKLCEKSTDVQRPSVKKDFLMTVSEMYDFHYSLPDYPDPTTSTTDDNDFVDYRPFKPSKKNGYRPIDENSPIFAVDCEMCVTKHSSYALTRISIVDENLSVVLDTLVKPEHKIIDYVTKYSGITRHMLNNVTTRLTDVQNMLEKLLPPDAILCGHSLNGDLDALRLYHPYVIDVAKLYNLTGNLHSPTSLKNLTLRFLGEEIQTSHLGHCSVQDAYATMKLAKLKLSQGIEFGNVLLGWGLNSGSENENLTNQDFISTRMKRHIDDISDVLPVKKLKTGENSYAAACNLTITCTNCDRVIDNFNCRNDLCVCRKLRRKFCPFCTVNLKIKDEIVSQHKISLIDALEMSKLSGELIFALFKKKKKTILWLENIRHLSEKLEKEKCEFRSFETSRFYKRFECRSNLQAVDFYKQKLYENDFNVVDLTLNDEDNGVVKNENCMKIDALNDHVMDIVNFTASNSVVCIVFKSNGYTICCTKIKF